MSTAAHGPSRRAVLATGATVSLAALLAGCVRQEETVTPSGRKVITLQTAAPAQDLDPILGVDVESQRVIRQVYDTLVTTDLQTGETAPSLATSWEVSPDQRTFTFTLRRDVTFSDGTPLDAEAVVANFKRWTALGDSTDPRVLTIATLFDTLKDPGENTQSQREKKAQESASPSPSPQDDAAKDSQDPPPTPQLNSPDPRGSQAAKVSDAVRRVIAIDSHTVRLELRRAIVPLLRALTHPAFSIVSPKALKEAGAEHGIPKSRTLSTTPVGSGAYVVSRDRNTFIFQAVPNHWAGQQGVDEARLTPQMSATRRAWDLESGRTDGFDLVTVPVLRELVQQAQQVLPRDPFSLCYLGMNQRHKLLKDQRIRRAISHAIDRAALLPDIFNASSTAAKSVLAPSLGVQEPRTILGSDTDKAKRLLKEAGYDGETIPLAYPTGVDRPYLPLPDRVAARLVGMLSAVGISVRPEPHRWDDGYAADVLDGRFPGLHLFGLQGLYRDAQDFLGAKYGRITKELAYDSPEVRRRIRVALTLTDTAARQRAYSDISELISVDAPVVPLVYPISSVAVGRRVSSYPISPVLNEPLRAITLA